MFCRRRNYPAWRSSPASAVIPADDRAADAPTNKRATPRQARAPRGYHMGMPAIPSYAGDRAAPNPPTASSARWEVVLRLHARHVICTGLVTDKSISTLRQPGHSLLTSARAHNSEARMDMTSSRRSTRRCSGGNRAVRPRRGNRPSRSAAGPRVERVDLKRDAVQAQPFEAVADDQPGRLDA